jgi:hypothetical protein
MGVGAELYTYPVDAVTREAEAARANCLCRFRGPGEKCDQSQHRGARAFVSLRKYPSLRKVYGKAKIPLGLCSISPQEEPSEPWIVCPHRLFYIAAESTKIEQYVYRLWGLDKGDRVALWTEIKLQESRGGKDFDFTLDYVFRRVFSEGPLKLEDAPCLVEIMTASTSGGGVERCFVGALQGRLISTKTSINYRQVLARMMSQFVAKAQIAHDWGGKAVWIVHHSVWPRFKRQVSFSMDMSTMIGRRRGALASNLKIGGCRRPVQNCADR